MFRKKSVPPSEPTKYPNGSFVRTEKGYFYIVAPNKRYRIITRRLLDSWSPHRVVETTESALVNYRVAAKMKFRNGSLIHNFADGKIYLISDGKRNQIVSPDTLELIGAKDKEIVTVSEQEVNLHDLGETIT